MSSSKSGCSVSTLFGMILIASVALNIVLLTGCSHERCLLCKWGPDRQPSAPQSSGYDATDGLREIATKLGVEADGKKAYELADLIKTHLYVEASGKRFPRECLTDQQLEEVKERLPEKKAEIIGEYQRFIKSLEGKRFVVIP